MLHIPKRLKINLISNTNKKQEDEEEEEKPHKHL